MKKIILLVTVISGIAVLSRCGSGNTPNDVQDTTTDVVSGENIYSTQCATCHGKNGDLGASGATALSQSKLNLQQRIEVITNGRAKMMAYSGLLSEVEIKAVAEYLEKLKK
jgi:mono/diheme cytochrome c family protein